MHTMRIRSHRDTINKTITICIYCPVIIRTDPLNTLIDKAFNFKWCPSKLASHYGYQPDEIRQAWLKLLHTRYARTIVPQLCLERLLGKALKLCELERAQWNFKRSFLYEEEYTTT